MAGAKYREARDAGYSDSEIIQNRLGTAQAKPDLSTAPANVRVGKAASDALGFASRPVVAVVNAYSDAPAQAVGGTIRELRRGMPPVQAIGAGAMQGVGRALEHVRSWPMAGPFRQPLPPQDTTTREQLGELGFTRSPIPDEVSAALNQGRGFGVGSVAQGLTSPEAASAALEYGATLPIDAVAGLAARPAKAAFSAVTNPLRQVPGIKQVGRTFSRGFDIADPVEREALREIVQTRMGEKSLADALLDERIAGYGDLPPEAQMAISDAVEEPLARGGALRAALPMEHQGIADDLTGLYGGQVAGRQRRGLRPNVLGALDDAAEVPVAERARYRPRPATEEAQKLYNDKSTQYGVPSGLSTRLAGRRKSDPRALTSEVEADLVANNPGLEKSGAIRPLFEATKIAGKSDNAAAAHADILNDVVEMLKNKKGGKNPLSELRGGSGFSEAGKARLAGTKVDDATFAALKDLDEVLRPENYDKAQAFYRSFNQGWKTLVTRVNPQFGSRNAQWNAAIGFAWGNRDPRNWGDAATVLSRAADSDQIRGLGMTGRELWEEATRNRVIGGGFTKQELAATRRNALTKAGEAVLDKPNAAIEDISRLSYYIHARRGGATPAEARKRVSQIYFDYTRDQFTKFENELRGNWVPFYSWSRRIVPLFMRSALEKPSAVAGGGIVQKNFGNASQEDLALMPDVAENLALVRKPKPGQKPNERVITSVGGLQGFQQGNIFGDRGRGLWAVPDAAATSVYPQLGIAAQIAMQRNSFFGSKFTGKPDRKLSGVGELVAQLPAVREKFNISEKGGNLYGPEWYDMIARSFGSAPQFVDDVQAAHNGDKGAEQRIVRWLTGISTQTRDLTGAKRAQAFRDRLERSRPRADRKSVSRAALKEQQRLEREGRLLGQ